MKKSSTITIAVIVLIIVVGGGYLIFHKSKPATTSSTGSSSQAAAVNNSVVITKTSSSLGQYLAEPNGQALYTYGADTSGVSNCTGSCLSSWPAYQDTGSTTGLPSGISTIKRTDNGETQYTYNGMPLYTFVGDTDGKATGNGVMNFSLAKPAASTSSSPSTSTSTQPAPAAASSTSSY